VLDLFIKCQYKRPSHLRFKKRKLCRGCLFGFRLKSETLTFSILTASLSLRVYD